MGFDPCSCRCQEVPVLEHQTKTFVSVAGVPERGVTFHPVDLYSPALVPFPVHVALAGAVVYLALRNQLRPSWCVLSLRGGIAEAPVPGRAVRTAPAPARKKLRRLRALAPAFAT